MTMVLLTYTEIQIWLVNEPSAVTEFDLSINYAPMNHSDISI